MRETLRLAAKAKTEILEETLRKEGYVFEEWSQRTSLFTLVKAKTAGEARNLVLGAERENGYEAWRNLSMRFEPQVGIRRMREVAELSQLQNKRCKNAAETTLVVLEVDRRRRS